jgi:hypothetical protein
VVDSAKHFAANVQKRNKNQTILNNNKVREPNLNESSETSLDRITCFSWPQFNNFTLTI